MPHQLIICEKPSAAAKIAYALAERRPRLERRGGVPVYTFERGGRTVVVVPALGHLYSVAQGSAGWSFPIFDVGWAPLYEVSRKARRTRAWLEVISGLAREAESFVSACDFDTEGSLIAYMILKHACAGADTRAGRMKFSTLTKGDLVASYEGMMEKLDYGVIFAGKARHELDWIFGVNVSRALMDSLRSGGGSFEVLSAGRVQSPTLAELKRREEEINLHLPDPFWLVRAEAETVCGGSPGLGSGGRRGGAGEVFPAAYMPDPAGSGQVLSLREAERVVGECNGSPAAVMSVDGSEVRIPPPPPFSLGDLQGEAYRLLGMSPFRTQKVAESLYLDALISYPRTSSQRLPPSIDCRRILRGLEMSPCYRKYARELLCREGQLRPRQGRATDSAHPAIHPTGNVPGRRMRGDESRLFDLIVRRFLAAFGECALKGVTVISLDCRGHRFEARGERMTCEGWTRYYGPHFRFRETPLPKVSAGDGVLMRRVWHEERFTEPPPRFNMSSIIGFMERNGIGTKATRATILENMYRRGYITGARISVTELGLAVVEVLERFFPALASVELTRRVEGSMEEIEAGKRSPESVVMEAVSGIKPVFEKIISDYERVGEDLGRVLSVLRERRRALGPCPACGGRLVVINSKRSGKRFVGCTGYGEGCRLTMPLPQNGFISATGKRCKACGFPVIEVRGRGRRAWRLCINVGCPSKKPVQGLR